jgi:hypothetical protein
MGVEMAGAAITDEGSFFAGVVDAVAIGFICCCACVEATSAFGGDMLAFVAAGDSALDDDCREFAECWPAAWIAGRVSWCGAGPMALFADACRAAASGTPGVVTEMHSRDAQPRGALMLIVRPPT